MAYGTVAPFEGAWIEISSSCTEHILALVAPFEGAWIEIDYIRAGVDQMKCRTL